MIVFTIVLGILFVISVIVCAWALVERDLMIHENKDLKKIVNMYRNMYYGLKESKIEESQWKDMTTEEITKAILEEQYKKGRLDVSTLLNEGIVRRREDRWGWM